MPPDEDPFQWRYLINAQGVERQWLPGIHASQITKIGFSTLGSINGIAKKSMSANIASMEEAVRNLPELNAPEQNKNLPLSGYDLQCRRCALVPQTRNSKHTGAAMLKIAVRLAPSRWSAKTGIDALWPNKLDELLRGMLTKTALWQAGIDHEFPLLRVHTQDKSCSCRWCCRHAQACGR